MKKNLKININIFSFFTIVFIFFSIFTTLVYAEDSVYIDASTLFPKAEIFLSPQSAKVQEGGTIQVPIFLDTQNKSINTIDLMVHFDPTKMIIINPSGDNSIVGIWVQPPTYSNTDGIMRLSGVIPEGITTKNGLITTITFRAIATGQSFVAISDSSRILANDGQGTEVDTQVNKATYTITSKQQKEEGVKVFSETHPFQDNWYNNKNPVIKWEKNAGVTGFSFILDRNPSTIPNSVINIQDTSITYKNLIDGTWYFHIKEQKDGIWSQTTNFVINIDTNSPADFQPKLEIIRLNREDKPSISFSTTDMLSGIDHYEIGIVEKTAPPQALPIFNKINSPYQLPTQTSGISVFIIRAYDKAGNKKDESLTISNDAKGNITVEAKEGSTFIKIRDFIIGNILWILILVLLLVSYYLLRRRSKHIHDDEKYNFPN